jgi:diguanylate cyclase (GGDEF)-like protein
MGDMIPKIAPCGWLRQGPEHAQPHKHVKISGFPDDTSGKAPARDPIAGIRAGTNVGAADPSGVQDMFEEQVRKLVYISSDAPTMDELELLNDSRERIGLIIRARWIILGVLATYGIIPYMVFRHYSIDLGSITPLQCVFPVIAWCVMVTYNAFFQYSYKWFANIRPLNQIQLLLDLFFVTVVVHYSGGAVSWFWPMYLIVTLESVLVMEKFSDTFAFALGGALAYGGLLLFEFHGLIPAESMPFENLSLQRTLPYGVTKWAWVSMTNMGLASIGVFLMKTVRDREDGLRKLVIKDSLTSLYNRGYFFYRLNSELQRAKRYKRPLSLLLMDMDRFKRVNDRYGHLAGDELLRVLSKTISDNVRYSRGTPSYELDIPCRYGGDEFAIILPETTAAQAAVAAARLGREIGTRCGREAMGRIRSAAETHPEEELEVSVSIGVASFPEHAADPEGLVKAADDAMYAAKRSDAIKVIVSATDPPAVPGGRDRDRRAVTA